jgi:hypothetical protein
MQKGATVTNLLPGFQSDRIGCFVGEITEVPFYACCRSQVVMSYKCSDQTLAERMGGYHWITFYGDYHREVEYALRRTKIAFDDLDLG